jgi:ribosomal protein S18 acetylase RimI-like enzyme
MKMILPLKAGMSISKVSTFQHFNISTISPKMITIRKANISDAPTIIDFQKRMAWETESLRLDTEVLTKGVNSVFSDPSKGEYYIADSDGKIVASLLITFEWSDWRNKKMWWIQSVYVISEFRRKGVFTAMYSFLKNEAEKGEIAGLRLYVELNNIRAQKTYKTMGMDSEHYLMYEWLKD